MFWGRFSILRDQLSLKIGSISTMDITFMNNKFWVFFVVVIVCFFSWKWSSYNVFLFSWESLGQLWNCIFPHCITYFEDKKIHCHYTFSNLHYWNNVSRCSIMAKSQHKTKLICPLLALLKHWTAPPSCLSLLSTSRRVLLHLFLFVV